MIEMEKYLVEQKISKLVSLVCNLTFNFEFLVNTSNIDLSIAYKDLQGTLMINSSQGCFPSLKGDFAIDRRVRHS